MLFVAGLVGIWTCMTGIAEFFRIRLHATCECAEHEQFVVGQLCLALISASGWFVPEDRRRGRVGQECTMYKNKRIEERKAASLPGGHPW